MKKLIMYLAITIFAVSTYTASAQTGTPPPPPKTPKNQTAKFEEHTKMTKGLKGVLDHFKIDNSKLAENQKLTKEQATEINSKIKEYAETNKLKTTHTNGGSAQMGVCLCCWVLEQDSNGVWWKVWYWC